MKPTSLCFTRTPILLVIVQLVAAAGVVAAASAASESAEGPSSTSLGGLLRRSDIALMPEGTSGPPDSMLPLRPTVVAWGNDALGMLDRPDALKKRTDDYFGIGIRLQACNVWMLTATDRVLHDQPQYQDAVCIDIAGNRIVPPWLDSEYQGVKPYWGCTNHLLFRQQIAERAMAGIVAGANMLHLDDHLGTAAAAEFAGGCFCDHCMRGFRNWLKDTYASDELKALGIEDIDSFDYRQLVRAAGFKTFDQYQQGTWDRKVPLRDQFLAYQRQAASALVRQLGAMATARAGRDIPVGVNAFNLSPTQLSDAHVADFFANEVEHYGVEDTVPPLVYKLGDALGKPVFSTGAGHDWIRIGEEESVTRVRRWIATAHAMGHHFMYAQRKWGFSKETGTRWYSTPISTYQPLTSFITDHADLFDGYQPVMQVGLLYSNRACRENHWEVRQICKELHNANVPFGLAIAGDDWLQHRLTEKELSQFDLIIVPEPALLDGEQKELIDRRQEQDRAVVWQGVAKLQQRVDSCVSVENAPRVWALPRSKPDDPQAPLVIHLLNQNYDPDTDAMRACSDFRVRIGSSLIGPNGSSSVSFVAPGRESVTVSAEKKEGDLVVRVPQLDLWGIIKVTR